MGHIADLLLHVQPKPKTIKGQYVFKVMEVWACVALILPKTHVNQGQASVMDWTLRRGLSTLKGGNSRVYPYPYPSKGKGRVGF